MVIRNPSPETEVAEAPRAPERPNTREWLQERIDMGVAISVGVSWFVLTFIAGELEPATDRSEPLLGTLLGVFMTVLFFATLVGLAMRRRWGLVGSSGGAVIFTAMVVACPVSGHHPFGAWWYGELVCALALMVISFAALQRGSGSANA
jgi:hypothetical protein